MLAWWRYTLKTSGRNLGGTAHSRMGAMVADLQKPFEGDILNCNLISLMHAFSLAIPERVALRMCS